MPSEVTEAISREIDLARAESAGAPDLPPEILNRVHDIRLELESWRNDRPYRPQSVARYNSCIGLLYVLERAVARALKEVREEGKE